MADPRCRFLTKIKYYHKKLYETRPDGFPMIGDEFKEERSGAKGERIRILNFIKNSARLFVIR